MLYLLSLPDNWKLHVNHLVKHLKEGRIQILSTLQELKDAKYIHHHKMGFKDGWQYFVFETPTEELAFKEFLRTIQVSEQFEKPNDSGNTPPLQKTHSNYKDTLPHKGGEPFSQFDELKDLPPPTEEEEIEIERRRRERPANAPKIVSLSRWKLRVLFELRLEKDLKKQADKIIEAHREQSLKQDGKKIGSFSVSACKDRVEFTCGSSYFSVPYNISDAEWKQRIGDVLSGIRE